MKIKKIPTLYKGQVNAVIETPRGCQNKFDFDPKMDVFILSKTLPMGTVFPFDFGFIPQTLGQDGDPLDVLVIMDEHAYPGCLVQTRLLGVLEATQEEKKGKKIRNDRLVAVTNCSVLYENIKNIDDLNKSMVKEIENFFIDYNKHEGKHFQPLGWKNSKTAMKVIDKARIS
ncbi:MAG TPA: inorganic diphosphatase [Puia sp.]|nr:inorganic diphosphatase [Puia sp.]